jgi:pseudouridine synthase
MLTRAGKTPLSQAALESLAVIAYKGPATRAEIESIRGVGCAGVIKTLLDKKLVRISGRAKGPGRPLLYAVTDAFLLSFGLNSTADLPKLKEISELMAVTTVRDTHGRKTVMNLIPSTDRRLFPVGRLDKETTGILLLTDDGDLAYRLTHPKFRVDKIYEATVDRKLTTAEKSSIASGIDIGEGEIGRAEVVGQEFVAGDVKITLKLRHGKKREVRRILKTVGVQLKHLHRSAFAGITLGDLKAGESRFLTTEETYPLVRSQNNAPSAAAG